jgi:hypothetical protein
MSTPSFDAGPQSADRRPLFLLGAGMAALAVAATVADIVIGSTTGSDLTALPRTAIARFEEFGAHPLLGLYHLDFLNALVQLVTIPVYVALLAAHPGRGRRSATLATALFLVASATFVSTNAALPMMQLAREYAAAGSEPARAALAAAGEAFLARGAHGSLGALPAFVLTALAGVAMSIAMIRGGRFARWASFGGLAGNVLLLGYLVVVTFVPGASKQAMALAMPGGLLALAWMVAMVVGLARLARAPSAD